MEENKKSKAGLIILIIIILLLILFAVWYFLLRDKGETNNNGNNNQQQEEKKDEPKETKGYQYDYREGVLTPIVDENGIPKQTDFVIDGIILIGNRHDYRGDDDTM